jgi:predicted transcriptional regulator
VQPADFHGGPILIRDGGELAVNISFISIDGLIRVLSNHNIDCRQAIQHHRFAGIQELKSPKSDHWS